MTEPWPGFEAIIPGEPVPKGSMRVITNRATGKAQLIPMLSASQRKWLTQARRAVPEQPLKHLGAVAISCEFVMARPKSISERKRPHPLVPPDIDKMLRNVLDVLSGRVIKDDSQVCEATVKKRYAQPQEQPHTWLRLTALEVQARPDIRAALA